MARRGARQDPPRAADRRDGPGRRAAPHAVLRLGRLDAAVAGPPGRDVRLDRRPRAASTGCGRTRWPRSSWIDRYGDRDGDGFVEYERRSRARPAEPGLEGLRRRDPRPRRARGRGPDRPGRGPGLRLRREAPDGAARPGARRRRARRRGSSARRRRSRPRFEEAFWVEDQRYYAMALDGDKRQADAIGSNAGPVPVERDRRAGASARRRRPAAAARRCSRAGGSGRIAAGQPGYNPIGYHTGTVWPHDTSLIAAGLKRYGFDDEANRLVGQVFEAAQHFPEFRLPELFCGFDRADVADAGAVPGRLLAAGVGRRRGVPVPPDDARAAGPRRARRAGAAATRTCPTGSAR